MAAFNLFNYMRTQWRIGPGGACGLDYVVLHQKMDRLNLSPDDYDDLEGDIQVMEVAALNEMHKPT